MKIEASPGVALERRPLPGCVFVLMSGGVDSSVAALLLLRRGWTWRRSRWICPAPP